MPVSLEKLVLTDLFLALSDHSQAIVAGIASNDYDIGAVILLKYEDGTMKALAHASGTLLPAEIKYPKSRRRVVP